MILDPLVVIAVPTLAFAVGYLLGHTRGLVVGKSIGWLAANAEIRRVIARTKGAA